MASRDGAGEAGRATILFVAPPSLTRAGLARVLEALAPDLRILPLPDVAGLAQAAQGSEPALVLLDIGASPFGEPAAQRAIAAARAQLPDVPVALLVDREAAAEIVAAVESGIRGYIPSRLEPHLVVEALRLVAVGGTFVPAEPLLASLEAAAVIEPAAAKGEPAPGGFTGRQRAVLDLMCQGRSNRAIADALGLPLSTVKVHARQIMRRLGAANRTQVAMRLSAQAPSPGREGNPAGPSLIPR